MAKKKRGKTQTAPKGCKLVSGNEKESTAKKKAERLRKDGQKARVVTRSPNGKKKHYVFTCGKRKR